MLIFFANNAFSLSFSSIHSLFLHSKDVNLDCRLHLCPCRHHSKTPPSGTESLHNFTDTERHPLRKSAARSAIGKLWLQKIPDFKEPRCNQI